MSRTLLVTDDAMIIRELIKDAASQAGWTIAGEACNGKEAAERYAQLRPTAVTLDLVMPEYDGLYALKQIMEQDPSAKVLVVSALDQSQVLKQAIKGGAGDFVVKPFDQKKLVESLDRLAPA